ncbi:hypothetical protein, partial [Leyella stercorea]|uniref:hypothetical protein n=1 Tax=Leyella stercorea TaxID=363265 RepID=UPI0024327B96
HYLCIRNKRRGCAGSAADGCRKARKRSVIRDNKVRIKERKGNIMVIFSFIFAICCAALAEAVKVNNKISLKK